jgi:hypothetical protein
MGVNDVFKELGITREQAAEYERLARLSEDELELEVARRCEEAIRRSEELRQQIGASTRKPRGLAKATHALRKAILAAFEDTGNRSR